MKSWASVCGSCVKTTKVIMSAMVVSQSTAFRVFAVCDVVLVEARLRVAAITVLAWGACRTKGECTGFSW